MKIQLRPLQTHYISATNHKKINLWQFVGFGSMLTILVRLKTGLSMTKITLQNSPPPPPPPVAERLRALFLNHSIISPLWLVWVRAPLWPHVRQAKFCLRVCQVVFLGVLPFSPHLLIGPSHMS